MIKKLLGTKRTVFHYTKPDVSKRKISEKHGKGGPGAGHVVTHKNGLYNQNLTIGELSLLRTFIWEYKEECESARDPYEYHRFLKFIHSWMFTDEKEPVLHADIVQDIEKGVDFEGKLP